MQGLQLLPLELRAAVPQTPQVPDLQIPPQGVLPRAGNAQEAAKCYTNAKQCYNHHYSNASSLGPTAPLPVFRQKVEIESGVKQPPLGLREVLFLHLRTLSPATLLTPATDILR